MGLSAQACKGTVGLVRPFFFPAYIWYRLHPPRQIFPGSLEYPTQDSRLPISIPSYPCQASRGQFWNINSCPTFNINQSNDLREPATKVNAQWDRGNGAAGDRLQLELNMIF